jgi:2-polyprenyl-3-methyl-5-hydroxy-6-metoxy-1,4-benzoquinol methylase
VEYWEQIRLTIAKHIENKGMCRVLEFGAGCTGFGNFINELRKQVIFDVQDITPLNKKYLETSANNVYIGDIEKIKDKYDIIFSTFVWEHICTPNKTLNHLLSLLQVSGSLFIASPRYDLPFYLSPSCNHMHAIVRLKVRNARGVKVPFRENAFRPVIDRNCVIVR